MVKKTIADLLNKVRKVNDQVKALPEGAPYVPYDSSYNRVYSAISDTALQDGTIPITQEGQQRLVAAVLQKPLMGTKL